MNHFNGLILFLIFCGLNFPTKGLIFHGLDNDANTTDPEIGFAFAGVGRLESLGGSVYGSAVHLGHGYMLTASHVFDQGGASSGVLRFEAAGGTHSIIPGSIQSVASDVDLRVFQISGVSPTIPWAKLYTGTEDVNPVVSYMAGWGYGRDNTALNSQSVNWDNTTSTKRWGAGVVRGSNLVDSLTYDHLYTILEPEDTYGAISPYTHETALTDKDSGSSLFMEENGEFYLIGIGTSIFGQTGRPTGSNVVFGGNDYGGDIDVFVRIGSYADDIVIAIPELSSGLLAGLLVAAGLVLFRSGRTPRRGI